MRTLFVAMMLLLPAALAHADELADLRAENARLRAELADAQRQISELRAKNLPAATQPTPATQPAEKPLSIRTAADVLAILPADIRPVKNNAWPREAYARARKWGGTEEVKRPVVATLPVTSVYEPKAAADGYLWRTIDFDAGWSEFEGVKHWLVVQAYIDPADPRFAAARKGHVVRVSGALELLELVETRGAYKVVAHIRCERAKSD